MPPGTMASLALVEARLAEQQVLDVRATGMDGAEGSHVAQVRLEIAPGEALVAPLALAGHRDVPGSVQADHVDLVIRIPPGADSGNALR